MMALDSLHIRYRILSMRSKSRSLVILICLFLISFKVAASSIFIEAAIERAQMRQVTYVSSVGIEAGSSKDSTDKKQDAHSLFLMSHVTANISDVGIALPYRAVDSVAFSVSHEILFTQNFPDSAFKPPKITA